MKCGSCGSDSFEVIMSQRICNMCGATVQNEVAVAIEHGLGPNDAAPSSFDEDGSLPGGLG